MPPTLDEQINQLKQTIADIESQRSILGDEVVEASLIPIRKKLADLESRAYSPTEDLLDIPERKRKLVTLLFLDVVGSTAMTQDLDPEDTLDMMDHALKRLAEPIGTHAGRVTRYTGDGFKAIFGDPVSHEDDPEQAIRAGLEILEVSKSLSQEIDKDWGIEDFQVRIGIDTGLAALGGETEAEDTVKGKVVNLAVRIESAAPPGGLLISHNTYRHVRGVFNVEPQEPITAKGFPEPVAVYLVENIKPRAFRVQTRGVEGVETRMVGRNDELKFLQDALMTAFEEGEGHLITISGEAGVGKSRLLYEFQNWLDLQPSSQAVRFFQGRGRQEAQGLPYSLLRDLFAFRFQILDDDTGQQARQKIESGFCEVFGTERDGMMRTHILGQMLGFDFSASPHLKGVLNDPEQLRNRGLMYMIQYFKTWSQEMPVVIFLDDIHWADDSSLDMVMSLGEQTLQLPFLIVCAARPTLFERRPYWGEGQDFHTLLELRQLTKRESRQLVSEILKLANEIPFELRELIITGAEGNPFYVEELIKMLIEDGVVIPGEETWHIELSLLEQVDVPSTLAGVLQARLDSLPTHERTVLQQASVIGRLFWDRIVSYIQAEGGNGGDPELITQSLTSLRDRELVFRHEESAFVGSAEYLFKHDILREVTYESVIKRLRRSYHGLVADWLIANCGDRINEYSGLIAEHLILARRRDQACQYFCLAGEAALAAYASSEAERYYHEAYELSPPEEIRVEVLTGLGEAYFRQGKTEEASEVWTAAIDLYQQLGDYDHLGDIYTRLSTMIWFTEDHHKAWNLCKEGLEVLEGSPDSQGYARLLAEGGRTAFFVDINDQAMHLCKRAEKMAERVGDLETQAEVKITIGIFLDDVGKSIAILNEVLEMAENNGLLRIAFRANYNIGELLSNSLQDLSTANKHTWRAAEIANQIGDVDALIFALSNAAAQSVGIGRLNTIEDDLREFLQSSTVTKARIDEFFFINLPYFDQNRGEWVSAVDAHKEVLRYLQDEGHIQEIIYRKLAIAFNVLEQNRFGYSGDLSEAEMLLMETIKKYSTELFSQFYLVQVYYRQGKITEAQDQLAYANDLLSQFPNKLDDTSSVRTRIEIELASIEQRWGKAIEICAPLIDTYKRGGYRYNWARELIDLGDALVGRAGPGDLKRARETYQQSLDMFTEMGASGYIKVLEERLGEL
ncbi:MAG: AAA family ATPase [Chloroflexota bacterium]|nr:MAG: AAA family ATPase [Chloroflexota bacterium]